MGDNKVKVCPQTGLPKMTGWGISGGIPPLTSDPENPYKPFANYEMEDGTDSSGDSGSLHTGMQRKISPKGGR